MTIQDADARLAAIVASSDDAIVSKDLDGIVQTWNRGAEVMFGYTAAEIIGRSITVIIPEDRLSEEAVVLARIRAGDTVAHFETVRRAKDGRLLDISLTVSPVRHADGTIVGASKIARDITEQKRLQRASEEAGRLKDEFLAVLSHELRTPLNTVMGYVHMLQRPDLATSVKAKALDAVLRNTESLTRLVNDLLDMSRMVTGKLRLSLSTVSIPAIVDDAIETARSAIAAKKITLRLDLPAALDLVGDADRLRQVIWNLLLNAAKFTPIGGSIDVGARLDGGEVRIQVADTGVGIAPEHLGLVFQRFWQGEASMSKRHSGLGIGLALARHIVELHGGTIEVSSEGLGKGATFVVRLPVVGVPVDAVHGEEHQGLSG